MSTHEKWRAEMCAAHRWGQEWSAVFTERLPRELEELETLWQAAAPLADGDVAIVDQVLALEICNWRLTDSILDLTAAIGAHVPVARGIGHRACLTGERWTTVWAHSLALQQYLWAEGTAADAFAALLDLADPDGAVRTKVADYLGERDETKELLVQRLLYALDWMVSHFPWGSTWQQAQDAGIAVLEARLRELGVDAEILRHLQWPAVDGRLQPCSHKWVRRLDIIISSIGAKQWRGRIPFRGTDGLELARVLDEHLEPLGAWTRHSDARRQPPAREPGATIWRHLGAADPAKLFLARLLHSLLTSQQIKARIKGEERSQRGA